ncbi:HAD-IC family P-type ATPase [Fodinibius sp. Rm-B-1B1-1]|uniref:cation-translocating P-type ATPase n=1 Tax=Fodinibius alkaliphilus TaxID=3140241 RepID=UPI003159A312
MYGIDKNEMEKPVEGDINQQWYKLEPDRLCNLLETSSEQGLSRQEVRKRVSYWGPNIIETEKEVTRWQIAMHQFKDPLIYILLGAAFVTLLLQDYFDSIIIVIAVLLNAIIGYIQERKSQSAIRSLTKLGIPKAHVIREGKELEVPGSELVPGDIVLLSSGGRVSADMRLLSVKGLEVDESALTGESAVIHKTSTPLDQEKLLPADQKNMVFSGTTVVKGRGKAVVVRIAGSTELGKIAKSVRDIGIVKTPLQEKMDHLGHTIGYLVLAFSLIIVALGNIYSMDPDEIFVTVVAMAVSAIPEGLPVVLTVTLAIGVSRMAKRQAVIRYLPAVETLGSTTVIGSDKTGTLTKNQMTVRHIWADNQLFATTETGYQLEGMVARDGRPIELKKESGLYYALLAGTLANEANITGLESGEPQGDPTEIALHVSAFKAGVQLSDVHLSFHEIDILPFEPEKQFMATLNKNADGRFIFLKGAPEVVINKCSHQVVDGHIISIDREKARKAAIKMAGRGLRVLAMAYRRSSSNLLSEKDVQEQCFVLAGLQGMEDPIRPEAIEAVQIAHEAGIRVIMITGDHEETAVAIGRQLGLDPDGKGALEGKTLGQLSDEEFDRKLRNINIFARVTPEHKYRIVKRLKQVDHIVAVTGDGVNDAPALRAAHIGVAMGKGGTDVAREASDMVLSDDNFVTITAAIEEGRIVFSNIRKVTFFLLSTAVGELIVIFVAILMNWPLPFIAVQILWINLVTSGLQDVALAFEPGEPDIQKRRPRPPKEGILTVRLMERLGGVGLVLAVGTLYSFWWAMEQTNNLDMARTVAMTQMVVFQFFHVLNCRSLDRSLFTLNFFSNKFLFLSLFSALLAHISLLYVDFMQATFRTVPLAVEQWVMIFFVGSFVIIGGEFDKLINKWRKSFIG